MAKITFAPGRYWGKVINQQLGKTSTDKPQIVISFAVLGKVDPADPEGALLPCPAGDRTVFRVITDKTAEWAAQDLEKLGFTGARFSDVDLNSSAACDMRGNEAAFSCIHSEYPEGSGDLREKWSVASDGGSFEATPLEPKEARQLDAMFGKYLKKTFKASEPDPTRKSPSERKKLPPDPEVAEMNAKLDEAMAADAAEDDIPW